MSRPGITYTDVSKAAQQIVGQGKAPTIERIRALLRTGSNGTIGTHLRVWRTQDTTQQLALQTNLPEEFVALMKGLWERLIHQADSQVETIKQGTQHEILQLKQTTQHLEKENAQGQQLQLQTKQERDALTQEKAALEQIIIQHQTEVVSLQAKQEGVAQQLAEKQARIDELHRQNQQTQENLEHYRAASLEQRQLDQQRSEQQQRELEQTVHSIKNEMAHLHQQKIDLQQSNERLNFEKTSLQAQLEQITPKAEMTLAALNEANQLLAQQTHTQQHWQAQHKDLQAKFEDQAELNVALKMQLAVLSEQIDTTKAELTEIRAQNKTLGHEKWFLGQEKAQLFGQLKQLQENFQTK